MAPCLKHAGIREPRSHYCGSPLNPAPAGGLRLSAGKHTGILTELQTKDKEEMEKI